MSGHIVPIVLHIIKIRSRCPQPRDNFFRSMLKSVQDEVMDIDATAHASCVSTTTWCQGRKSWVGAGDNMSINGSGCRAEARKESHRLSIVALFRERKRYPEEVKWWLSCTRLECDSKDRCHMLLHGGRGDGLLIGQLQSLRKPWA